MKRLLFLLALALTASGAAAQSLEQYKGKLKQADPSYGSRTEITEHGTAAGAVRAMQGRHSQTKVLGYRVRIFFDNSQNARGQANAAMSRFKEIYPDIPAYLVYENPYFKVTVGNCLTEDEARILLGKIQGTFNRAFPIQEEIPLSLFTESATASAPAPAAENP